MADPPARPSVVRERAKTREPRRRRLGATARTWLRAIHRDVGYSAVGLTFVYAASGIAVNHVAYWDPNFRHATRSCELTTRPAGDDKAASRQVRASLGI